jgi:hypothetical protein
MVCQLAQINKNQHNSNIIAGGTSLTKTHTEQLIHTQGKHLFETAKPLFIGSIPIAASNYINKLATICNSLKKSTVVGTVVAIFGFPIS